MNLWRLHIILGITATTFSILAGIGFTSTGIIPDSQDKMENSTLVLKSAIKEIQELRVQKIASQVFAILAAVSIYLMTVFNLGAKSNDTRNAWRELNTELLKFNQNIIEKPAVIEAYERAETSIGGITFSKEGIEKLGMGGREVTGQQEGKGDNNK